MAKKYIDAEKLERHFENCICEAYNTNGVTEDFEIALKATKNQPAADVQEVKHGRWITSEITMDSGCTSCSCCHSEYYIGDLQNLEGNNDFVMYCPHCGARMDGEENENV